MISFSADIKFVKKYIVSIFIIISILQIISAQEFFDFSENSSDLESENIFVPNPDALAITENVPEIFDGIWEGNDRYILFQDKSELEQIIPSNQKLPEKKYIWIYLKTFYGWYLDRAAEKTTRENSNYKYDRNNTVFRDIQNITIDFKPLIQSENCNAFEIILTYPTYKESLSIPVCIIDGKLYLDFAIKTNSVLFNDVNQLEKNNFLYGSWSRVALVSGIKVSKPIISENIISMYVADDCVYYIRYWKTNMPYSEQMAIFSDGEKKYEVPKHIRSAGNIYTCVTGRSLVIRNVSKKAVFSENYVINEEHNVIAFGNPYLKKISENCQLSDMMKIVNTTNAKKAPNPNPPFEPRELDFHLEEINELELNNQIMQAVRKRQQEFYQKYK